MATENKNNEIKKTPKKEETIKFFISRRPEDPESIYVGVNGKTYQVKTGVEVELPRAVYNVLKLSMKQEMVALESREKLKNQEITSL